MHTNRVGTDGRPIREIDAGDYPASVSNDLLVASTQAIEALFKAKDTIHAFHSEMAWDIYNKSSPEMKQINSAINRLGKAIIFSGG